VSDLIIKEKEDRGVVVLYLKGRLEDSARDLRETLKKYFDAGTKRIVVDLQGMTELNSSELGQLIAAVSAAWRAECILVYSGAQGSVQRNLHIFKMDWMGIYDSVDEAVNAISNLSFTDYITRQKVSINKT
jgi:anti-anti-sigma factor